MNTINALEAIYKLKEISDKMLALCDKLAKSTDYHEIKDLNNQIDELQYIAHKIREQLIKLEITY